MYRCALEQRLSLQEARGADFVMVDILSLTYTPTHIQQRMHMCTQVYECMHMHTNSSTRRRTSQFGCVWIKRSNAFGHKTLDFQDVLYVRRITRSPIRIISGTHVHYVRRIPWSILVPGVDLGILEWGSTLDKSSQTINLGACPPKIHLLRLKT